MTGMAGHIPVPATWRRGGFTLLETVVAMTLTATLGIVLFAWINTTLTNLSRVDEHTRKATAMDNALAFLQIVNPMQDPRGERLLGAYRIRWQATPIIAAPRRSSGIPLDTDTSGLYELDLFTVQASVFEGTMVLTEFKIQAVGYRRVGKSPEALH